MKKPLLCLVSALTFSVHASDLDWTGFYAGVNAGEAQNRNQMTTNLYAGIRFNDDVGADEFDGGIAGVQLGYDLQQGNWVIGAQGLLDVGSVKGSHHYAGSPPDDIVHYKTKGYASLSARVGYLLNGATLVYIKGGRAWTRNVYENVAPSDVPPQAYRSDVTRGGWMAGVGVEYRFARQASLFAEFNSVDFGKRRVLLQRVSPLGQDDFHTTVDQSTKAFLLGLNYRF